MNLDTLVFHQHPISSLVPILTSLFIAFVYVSRARLNSPSLFGVLVMLIPLAMVWIVYFAGLSDLSNITFVLVMLGGAGIGIFSFFEALHMMDAYA